MIERSCNSATEVAKFYSDNGVQEARLNSLNVQINRIPENGVFGNPCVGKITTDDGEVSYPAVGVLNEEDQLVGMIAVSSLYAGEAIPTKFTARKEKNLEAVEEVEVQEVKNPKSSYFGKFMVKSAQINNYGQFGSSQAQVVANIFGKKFKTTPKHTVVARILPKGGHFKDTATEAAKMFDRKTIYEFEIS